MQVAAEEFNELVDQHKDEEDEEEVPLVFLDLSKNSTSIGKVVSFKVRYIKGTIPLNCNTS